MLKNLTRVPLIGLWFGLVLIVSAASLSSGAVPAVTTGTMIAVLSILPAAVMLARWRGAQQATAREILRGER